jgi:hypothetical protein
MLSPWSIAWQYIHFAHMPSCDDHPWFCQLQRMFWSRDMMPKHGMTLFNHTSEQHQRVNFKHRPHHLGAVPILSNITLQYRAHHSSAVLILSMSSHTYSSLDMEKHSVSKYHTRLTTGATDSHKFLRWTIFGMNKFTSRAGLDDHLKQG